MLAETLSATGWTFMLCSIGAVATLLFTCYKRILTQSDSD